jgi:hypothetical protein
MEAYSILCPNVSRSITKDIETNWHNVRARLVFVNSETGADSRKLLEDLS